MSIATVPQQTSAQNTQSQQQTASVRGYVFDMDTRDPLPRASLRFVSKTGTDTIRTQTDDLGHYLVQIPAGTYEVQARFTGYNGTRIRAFTAQAGGLQILCPQLMPNFRGAVGQESGNADRQRAEEE